MRGKGQLRQAISQVVRCFQDSPSPVLRRAQIAEILARNRKRWRLAEATTVQGFIDFMLEETKLQAVAFSFPSRKMVRYTWGEVPSYELMLSLQPAGYFTHYTAMHLHELTEQIPRTVYLNCEQSPKPKAAAALTQGRIDLAFRSAQRVSMNRARHGDLHVCLLSGMHTGGLGVMDIEGPQGERLRATNLERTLIDITVRPAYAGGVFEVLKAFEAARARVSINRLSATLKRLAYTYPYHQAIGFYLERAGGYRQSQIDLLRRFDIEFGFYLTHRMRETDYCQSWRLFIPKGF